jgi:uncharacterized protein YjcR
MSIRNFFALLFIISLSTFVILKFYPNLIQTSERVVHDKKNDIAQKRYMPSVSVETNFESSDSFILLASLITSILSFLGFIISTYQSIQGGKRDEELFDLRREKERLEMEKIQAEIRALAKG